MKMKKLYFPIAALALIFSANVASAQVATPRQPQAGQASGGASSQIPAAAENPALKNTTLSGIDLFPNQKMGTFQLRLTQQLKFTTDTSDVATLTLSDETGNVVYTNRLNPKVNV